MPRPKTDVVALARSHTDLAMRTLAGIVASPKSPTAARVKAAEILLNRGWGMAPQFIASGRLSSFAAGRTTSSSTVEEAESEGYAKS